MSFRSLLIMGCLSGGLWACGGASSAETEAWNAALAKGNEAAIDSFLLRYPESSYRAEAESKLEGMLWAFAEQEQTVYYYRNYAQRFPQGKHAAEVEAKVQAIAKEALDFAALTSKTFSGVIHNDQTDIQVIALKFAQIEQSDQTVRFVADINASKDIRKMVPGEIRMDDNSIHFEENASDGVLLGLTEGRVYARNGRLMLQSIDPNLYWSMK